MNHLEGSGPAWRACWNVLRRTHGPLAFAAVLAATAQEPRRPDAKNSGRGGSRNPRRSVDVSLRSRRAQYRHFRLLEWLLGPQKRRSIYGELFTDDYRGTCLDPAELGYHEWRGARSGLGAVRAHQSIQFDWAVRSSRCRTASGKTDPWHKQVSVITRVRCDDPNAKPRWVMRTVAFYWSLRRSHVPPDLIV